MAKDPADRYQTADEAFDVLKKCLAHVQQPLSSPLPAGLADRHRSGADVKAVLMTAGGVLLIAIRVARRSPYALVLELRAGLARWQRSLRLEPSRLDLESVAKPAAAADEIQQLIDRGRLMAEQTEKDLVRRDEIAGTDSISTRGFYLLMRSAGARARDPVESIGSVRSERFDFDPFPSQTGDDHENEIR